MTPHRWHGIGTNHGHLVGTAYLPGQGRQRAGHAQRFIVAAGISLNRAAKRL